MARDFHSACGISSSASSVSYILQGLTWPALQTALGEGHEWLACTVRSTRELQL